MKSAIQFLNNMKSRSIPLIDATEIISIHQNHDYSHVKSVSKNTNHKGIERELNGKIANLKNQELIYITDSDFILINGELKRNPVSQRYRRLFERYLKPSLAKLKRFHK